MATGRQKVDLTDSELATRLRTWASNRRRAGIGPNDCDLLDEAADRLQLPRNSIDARFGRLRTKVLRKQKSA